MLPFLVHMPRLFEAFVGAWLREQAPSRLRVHTQHRIEVEGTTDLDLVADVALFEVDTGRPVAVLDTKYKDDTLPSTADVSQVVTYAQALGCRHAILVYPRAGRPFRIEVRDIVVTTSAFSLTDDTEASGQAFLADLDRLISVA